MSPKKNHPLTVDINAANHDLNACDPDALPCDGSPGSSGSPAQSGKKASKSLRSKASIMKLLAFRGSDSKPSTPTRLSSTSVAEDDSPTEVTEQSTPAPRSVKHVRSKPLYKPVNSMEPSKLDPSESSGETLTPRTFRLLRKKSGFNLLNNNSSGSTTPSDCDSPDMKSISNDSDSSHLPVELPGDSPVKHDSQSSQLSGLSLQSAEGASLLTPLSSKSAWAFPSPQSPVSIPSFPSTQPVTPTSPYDNSNIDPVTTPCGHLSAESYQITSPTHTPADSMSSDNGNSFDSYTSSNQTSTSFTSISESEAMTEEEQRRRNDRFLAYIETKVCVQPPRPLPPTATHPFKHTLTTSSIISSASNFDTKQARTPGTYQPTARTKSNTPTTTAPGPPRIFGAPPAPVAAISAFHTAASTTTQPQSSRKRTAPSQARK